MCDKPNKTTILHGPTNDLGGKALAWLTAKQNYCLDVDWAENVRQSALQATKKRRKSMLSK